MTETVCTTSIDKFDSISQGYKIQRPFLMGLKEVRGDRSQVFKLDINKLRTGNARQMYIMLLEEKDKF